MNNKIPEIRFDGFADDWGPQQLSEIFFELFFSEDNKRFNVDLSIPNNVIILNPSTSSEQRKIENFFKQINNIISLHQRELENLKERKKGFLQKMFPKVGESVPQIRFPGFSCEWELRKLSKMANYKSAKGNGGRQSYSGEYEIININSISIDGGLKHSGRFVNESLEVLNKNDLVMVLNDIGQGILLGKVALIPENDKFVLSQRVASLRPNGDVNPFFLFTYINQNQKYFKSQSEGTSQLIISRRSVENFESHVPSFDEQVKIGLFFKQLDDTIALHEHRLNIIKEAKEGFLQKMLVIRQKNY